MAYYEGEALEQKIARGRLAAPEAREYAIQLADGLARAHEAGIVHRDIKPANVMVTDRGQIKIVDFGVAKGTGPELTREGAMLGTVGYMSPEQTRGDPVDHRTDLWSLGVVLYEMLTGARPFRGETEKAVVFGIRNDRPPPIATLAPDVPPDLARVAERCMAKDPAQRYASAGEVRAALETAAGRELAGINAAGLEAAGPEPAVPTRRVLSHRARWLAVSGIALIALASVGPWVVRRGAVDPPRAVAFRLLSTLAGEPSAATFSPDGRMVAFVDLSEKVPEVWVKNLTEGDPLRITSGNAPVMRPRWSAAGDRIVFARRGQGIWAVPPLGGPERRLVEEGMNPDLSTDGETMVFERGDEIWISGADGSDARRVEGVPPRSTSLDLTPALSPDGRWIAFFVSELGPLGDLWVIPSEGGVARRLTDDLEVGGVLPTWTPDGRFIVYASFRAGSRTLWGISPSGGETFPVTSGVGGDSEPALSRDGRSMVYTNVRRRWSLKVLDPRTGSERSILESRNGIVWPMVSPDGDRIAFFGGDAAGDIHVFTIELASGEVRQITRGRGEVNSMPQWSGDSKHLYYYHYQGKPERSFRRIPLDGGPSVEVAPWSSDVQCCAAVHPLEKVVAYVYRPPGEPQVARVRDLATGREADLPRPLRGFSWSADGRYLVGNVNDRIYRCRFDSLNDCEELTSGRRPKLPGDGSRLTSSADPSARSRFGYESSHRVKNG